MTTIQAGSIIETTISKIGTQGDGVGEYQGSLVIVPKTAAGDKITCKVKYTTGGRIHADLTHIVESSSSRVKAPCEYYTSCGGCGLQHINADTYKSYKLDLLTSAMNYSGFPLPSDIGWKSVGEQSRRRAFIRFDKNGKLGFYEHQSHNVIDIKKCLILDAEIEALLVPLKSLSKNLGMAIEGWMITNTDTGIDLQLHTEEKKVRNEFAIIEVLCRFAKENKISRISWKRGSVITPAITLNVPALMIGGMEISLPDEYFLQASKEGQAALLMAVTDNVPAGAKVLDLYSGVGVYSFAIADKVKHVSAYEISQNMIDAMESNIAHHNLTLTIDANCRDIDKYPLGQEELGKFDTVIINPPRTGALRQITAIAAAKVPLVIMVSCNSQTFARDAKILHEGGYSLRTVDAIDQFYYSHHLEQVGVFVRG